MQINQMYIEQPETLLQELIKFDTTNPPGNEKDCILFIQKILKDADIETQLYAKYDRRPNLLARIPGKGEAPPLLIYGHIDVVTTAGQKWSYPPFDGVNENGFIWGRGALDMKGGIAMMIAAMLQLKQSGLNPSGDLLFMALCDEENLGNYGAKYLIEKHPDIFRDVEFALGEFGGASIQILGKRFYPIQVAEKQSCCIKLKVKGDGGHGASIVRDNAVRKLAIVLDRITRNRMPIHITKPVHMMVNEMASKFKFPYRIALKLLLNKTFNGFLLAQLGDIGLAFTPMFYNTVNATIIQGGEKVNVVPSEICVDLDVRLLPGKRLEQFLSEFRNLIGFDEQDVEIEVVRYEPGPDTEDFRLFEQLGDVLKSMDPDGIPVPLLLHAVTDARHLSKLGIQSYGFTPMKLPHDFDFFNLAHAADERIPIEAVHFGTECIYRIMTNYH